MSSESILIQTIVQLGAIGLLGMIVYWIPRLFGELRDWREKSETIWREERDALREERANLLKSYREELRKEREVCERNFRQFMEQIAKIIVDRCGQS